jgi:hypothetical protein
MKDLVLEDDEELDADLTSTPSSGSARGGVKVLSMKFNTPPATGSRDGFNDSRTSSPIPTRPPLELSPTTTDDVVEG